MRIPFVQIFDLTSVDNITYSLRPTRAIVPYVDSSIYFADLKSLFKTYWRVMPIYEHICSTEEIISENITPPVDTLVKPSQY